MAALEGQALLDWAVRQLSLLGVFKRLTLSERALLPDVLLSGQLDARQLVRQATKAVGGGAPALQGVVEEVQRHLEAARSFRGDATGSTRSF